MFRERKSCPGPCAEFVFPYKEKTRWVLTRANISFFLWFSCVSSDSIRRDTTKSLCIALIEKWHCDEIEFVFWHLETAKKTQTDVNGQVWLDPLFHVALFRRPTQFLIIFSYFQVRKRERERRKKPESVSLGWFLRMWIDRLDEFYFILFHFI